MSINYNAQPHAVDVPVTDMDDPEDGIIFAEQASTQQNRTRSSFLDNLDFENNNARSESGGILNKFRSFFESRARQNDDYEMVLRFDVDSTNDSDDLDNQPPIDIRERRLQLLEKQVKNRTVVGSIFLLTVGILTFVLFFNKNSVTLLLNSGPSRKIYSNSTHEFH